jgi:hypothetical protein
MLIYYTRFSDEQIIFCEFYKICNNSEMFLEIKIGAGTFCTEARPSYNGWQRGP